MILSVDVAGMWHRYRWAREKPGGEKDDSYSGMTRHFGEMKAVWVRNIECRHVGIIEAISGLFDDLPNEVFQCNGTQHVVCYDSYSKQKRL